MKKIILISIAKEKKIKDFRLVITPSGRNRIGGIQTKDYGIISYPDKKDFEKIGELIYWAFNESDDKVIERSSNTKIEKQFYNCSSYRKVTNDYNMIFFELIEGIYSISLLKKDGILAFVLPEELLTVNYARDTLDFLLKKFNRLEIFSIDKVIFGNAWQNTIVLFAYKRHKQKWLFLGEINVDGNKKTQFTYRSHLLSREDHSILSQKELSSGLTLNDLFFINKIQKKFNIIWNIASSQTGIVTWANDFFILSHEEIIKNGLKEYGIPIIRKWSYIKNKLYFDKKDFSMLQKEGKPIFFLNFKGNIIDPKAKTYLNIGKKQWINLRYKCNSYKPNRYNIPNVHPAYLFFFKRSHLLPKLIYCPSWIMVTDSAYKIDLKDKKYQEFQFCFYNLHM